MDYDGKPANSSLTFPVYKGEKVWKSWKKVGTLIRRTQIKQHTT